VLLAANIISFPDLPAECGLKGKAIFYEHDDIPKEEQLKLWESLGLPDSRQVKKSRGLSRGGVEDVKLGLAESWNQV
jgi:hypothetical protein